MDVTVELTQKTIPQPLIANKESRLSTGVVSVASLLQYHKLAIPIYQRPYKWTTKHVTQLIDDIYLHKDKSAYRLGTIVIHQDTDDKLNIVDGQQRTITLILIARAISKKKMDSIKSPELKRQLDTLSRKMVDPGFRNGTSLNNIRNNYREIERLVAGMDEETIGFLFNKCEFIQFVLTDVSEAFQFFDAQNARGKDLEPHDLLKAYHLREFARADEHLKNDVVDTWESMQTKELARLFGEYLYRIKGWVKGYSAKYFTKDHADLFKGINMEKVEHYPYTEIFRIAHFYVDRYNNSYERKIDNHTSPFPFQLDQTIINGRRFFEMITHYKKVFDTLLHSSTFRLALTPDAQNIFATIDTYEGRLRTGDRYVKTLFECALVYYIDKFGFKNSSKAVEKIFVWAYTLRLTYETLQFSSVDNYVVYESNFFRLIKEANDPGEIHTAYLSPIEKIKSRKTDAIVNLFTHLRYYDKPS